MLQKLTASDRRSLIKLASSLPKGSGERQAILAGLKKSAANPRQLLSDVEGGGPGGKDAAADLMIYLAKGLIEEDDFYARKAREVIKLAAWIKNN